MRAILAMICIALLCSGCALTTATIDVPYQSITAGLPVPGADRVSVMVSTSDDRTTYRDRVSSKKNGYGMEMAAILASNDIPDTITSAFNQELIARGFKTGKDDVALNVGLVQFYNDFKIGFFAGDAVANVAFNVKIAAPNGTIAFTKYYAGTGTEPNIQIAGGDNARAALIKAFQAAVASVVTDPDFIKALIGAGSQGPQS